jgi:hypothetical protein
MTIFVDDSGDDRFSADGSQVGHVSDELRFDIWVWGVRSLHTL